MEVKVIQDTSWKRALNEARRTVGKESIDKEPSDDWKKMVIMAEHSPIKLVEYTLRFKDLRQWVGVHILRHEHLLPFIHTQRSDRRAQLIPRDELPQGTPNDQDFVVNVQTLINISRKRLCGCASLETREAWLAVKREMRNVDPVVASFMVPNCVYRGFCPEMHSCGFWKTERFRAERDNYINLIRHSETE